MRPIKDITKKTKANEIYGGRFFVELPVFDDGDCCLSCWKLTFAERVRVLFSGRVWLCVKGRQVPVWLNVKGDVMEGE